MILAPWEEGKGEAVKDCFRKASWKMEFSDEEDKITLAIICSRLQLPESMIFEDYVNIDSNVQTDEKLTETEILAEVQRGKGGGGS